MLATLSEPPSARTSAQVIERSDGPLHTGINNERRIVDRGYREGSLVLWNDLIASTATVFKNFKIFKQ